MEEALQVRRGDNASSFDPVEPLMAFAWTGRALGWIGRALGWIGRGLGKGILENECKNCGS